MKLDLRQVGNKNVDLQEILTEVDGMRIKDDDHWYSQIQFSQEIGPLTSQAFSNIELCEAG